MVVPHGAQFGVRWHSGLVGMAVPSASSRNMKWEQWGGESLGFGDIEGWIRAHLAVVPGRWGRAPLAV